MTIALILYLFSTQMFVVASVREVLLLPNTNQTIIPPLALNVSEPFLTSNASFAPANISLGANYDIQCDWQQYGFINTPSDCESAWRSWPEDTDERSWVTRRGPERDPNAYALPLMTMGPAARCYYELTMKPGRSSSSTHFLDIRTASAALAQSCITNKAITQGGIARSPGGDNNINIVMTEYAPRAQCNGPGTFPKTKTKIASCASILEIMETSRWPTVFGPRDDPATQFITPHLILTRGDPRPLLVYEFAYGFTIDNYECGLAIESSDQTDSESWYKLWQEANAIFAHCLRKGQSGYSQSLGEHDRIKIIMGSSEPPGLASNVSILTVMIA